MEQNLDRAEAIIDAYGCEQSNLIAIMQEIQGEFKYLSEEVLTQIAEKLGVTKPSVVRVLNLLMERGMIVKEYYGKIYLTDRGIFVAREVKKQLDEVLAHFPPVEEALTDEERFTAALALTAALPERVFTGRYDQMMGAEEAPSAAG